MNLRHSLVLLASSCLTLAVGVADHTLWQRELSSSILYLLPIALATWFGSRRAGLIVAAIAAASWHVVDLSAHAYTNPAAPYWNTGVRLLFFMICALFLSHVRSSLDHETELADTDVLTGTANSRRFYQDLERELARFARSGSPFTVVFLDLDNFKQVNDQEGHVVGDALLREIATSMRASLRSADMLARLGGDEFGLILPDTDEDGAALCLDRLRRNLSEMTAARHGLVTCSIGALVVRAPGEDPKALMRRADELMYRVKRAGGDRFEIVTLSGPEPGELRRPRPFSGSGRDH